MKFRNQNKRLFRLLAPLLALMLALSPLSSVAFSMDHSSGDMALTQAMDMSDMDNCEEMATPPDCKHCQDPAQCSNPGHLCGHAPASPIQNDFISYSLFPISYNPSYTEYLPTVAPEAAFRPPISL